MSSARNSAHFSVQFSDGLCHHPLCRVDWQLLTFAYCNMAVAAAGDATVPMLYGVLIDAIAIDQDVQKFLLFADPPSKKKDWEAHLCWKS